MSSKKVGKLKLTNDFKKKLESSLGHLAVASGSKPQKESKMPPPPPPQPKAKSIIERAKKRLVIGEDLEQVKHEPPKSNNTHEETTPQQITSSTPASIVINNNINYPYIQQHQHPQQSIPETYNKQLPQIKLDNKGLIMTILNKKISVKHLAMIFFTFFSGYMLGKCK